MTNATNSGDAGRQAEEAPDRKPGIRGVTGLEILSLSLMFQ